MVVQTLPNSIWVVSAQPSVSQLLSSWSMQSLPGRNHVSVTSATVANWSLCSKCIHVSQPFSKMIYAVCSTAADWLPLSLPENIQLWPSLSETASELWVNWTWWSRHHGNLTGTAVCIAEMDLLLLIGIIFIIWFTLPNCFASSLCMHSILSNTAYLYVLFNSF